LWNSRRYDESTDLYYYWYRHYKADIGRWLGRDPIEEDCGVNLYGLVGNEPVVRWDTYVQLSTAEQAKNKCQEIIDARLKTNKGSRKIILKEVTNSANKTACNDLIKLYHY